MSSSSSSSTPSDARKEDLIDFAEANIAFLNNGGHKSDSCLLGTTTNTNKNFRHIIPSCSRRIHDDHSKRSISFSCGSNNKSYALMQSSKKNSIFLSSNRSAEITLPSSMKESMRGSLNRSKSTGTSIDTNDNSNIDTVVSFKRSSIRRTKSAIDFVGKKNDEREKKKPQQKRPETSKIKRSSNIGGRRCSLLLLLSDDEDQTETNTSAYDDDDGESYDSIDDAFFLQFNQSVYKKKRSTRTSWKVDDSYFLELNDMYSK